MLALRLIIEVVERNCAFKLEIHSIWSVCLIFLLRLSLYHHRVSDQKLLCTGCDIFKCGYTQIRRCIARCA